MSETATKPNWCFIRIESEREHWNIHPKINQYVGKIYGIYGFNRSSTTNCCEITPSYYLNLMSWDWDFTPLLDALNDRDRTIVMDGISELFNGVPLEDGSSYYHVPVIERMIAGGKHKFHEAGDLDPEGEQADDEYGMLAEYWHPNPKF